MVPHLEESVYRLYCLTFITCLNMPPTPDRDSSIDRAPEARTVSVLAVMEYSKISAGSGKKSGRPAKTEKKKELQFAFVEGKDAYL